MTLDYTDFFSDTCIPSHVGLYGRDIGRPLRNRYFIPIDLSDRRVVRDGDEFVIRQLAKGYRDILFDAETGCGDLSPIT